MMWPLAVVAGFLLVLAIWRGTKGPKHSLESLRRPILDLLRRGYDCGFLIIDVPYSRRFVQLRKYIRSPGDYGIELGFPEASWSREYFSRVQRYCRENWRQTFVTQKQEGSSLAFVVVDFGRDVESAHSCVVHILREIFDVNEKRGVFVRLEQAHIEEDALVDR